MLSEEQKKKWGPTILAAAKYLSALLLGALASWLAVPPETVEVEKVVEKTVPVAQAAPPAPAVAEGKLRPGQRLFVTLVRKRLSERLQKDGFALVGRDATPLTKAQAERLLDNLDDEQIVYGAVQSGAIGDGGLLDRLGALIDWVVNNQDKIMKVIQFLMSILVLFADDGGTAPLP